MSGSGQVLGVSTTAGGAGAVAALPNTGGSRNVVLYVAVGSIVLGVAILASNMLRFVAKHRYTA
jgi:LPXTG-motif cell wall-anchored protein